MDGFWTAGFLATGSIGAGRILKPVEVEYDCSGLVEAVVGKIGVQEARGFIRCGVARGVTQDEEKLFSVGGFEDWLELNGFSIDHKFRESGGRHIEGGAKDGRYFFSVHRHERNPLGGDAIFGFQWIPV